MLVHFCKLPSSSNFWNKSSAYNEGATHKLKLRSFLLPFLVISLQFCHSSDHHPPPTDDITHSVTACKFAHCKNSCAMELCCCSCCNFHDWTHRDCRSLVGHNNLSELLDLEVCSHAYSKLHQFVPLKTGLLMLYLDGCFSYRKT